MNAEKTIQHAKYLGKTDTEGYPTSENYADPPVARDVYGWYPGESQLSESGDYTRRVVQSTVVLMPDVSPYSPLDKITFPDGGEWFVTDINDYTTGPFKQRQGGTVTVKQVSG